MELAGPVAADTASRTAGCVTGLIRSDETMAEARPTTSGRTAAKLAAMSVARINGLDADRIAVDEAKLPLLEMTALVARLGVPDEARDFRGRNSAITLYWPTAVPALSWS